MFVFFFSRCISVLFFFFFFFFFNKLPKLKPQTKRTCQQGAALPKNDIPKGSLERATSTTCLELPFLSLGKRIASKHADTGKKTRQGNYSGGEKILSAMTRQTVDLHSYDGWPIYLLRGSAGSLLPLFTTYFPPISL